MPLIGHVQAVSHDDLVQDRVRVSEIMRGPIIDLQLELPEASLDPEGDLATGHDDIGGSLTIAPRPTKAVARSEPPSADEELWRCIFTLDAGHHPAAVGGETIQPWTS